MRTSERRAASARFCGRRRRRNTEHLPRGHGGNMLCSPYSDSTPSMGGGSVSRARAASCIAVMLVAALTVTPAVNLLGRRFAERVRQA